MRRKRHPFDEDEKLDRWLVSYADFITLLFAFFVVLYAISSINENKYKQVTKSLTAAFKVTPKSLKPIQVGEISRDSKDNVIHKPLNENATETESLKQMADAIQKEMLALLPAKDVVLRRSKDWLEIELSSQILFASGDARLIPHAQVLLQKIAAILANYPNPINVEGYTDDQPINTERFPSNWELSATRAVSVVHLFARSGIDPERIAAIAYGEHRPIASNATPAGRKKNRRVVVTVLASNINIPYKRQIENASTSREAKKNRKIDGKTINF